MEILGIGAPELLFIIIIAIIVLGPRDMQKAGRTIGRWLNKVIHSDGWQILQKTSAEMRHLPRSLMREANLDLQQTDEEIRKALDMRKKPTASNPGPNRVPSNEPENAIQPPAANPPEPDPGKHD